MLWRGGDWDVAGGLFGGYVVNVGAVGYPRSASASSRFREVTKKPAQSKRYETRTRLITKNILISKTQSGGWRKTESR
jgi:hypothetical protein